MRDFQIDLLRDDRVFQTNKPWLTEHFSILNPKNIKIGEAYVNEDRLIYERFCREEWTD